jgi:hypothetical protein
LNPSVRTISGKKGELLSVEYNPQVHKNPGSGQFEVAAFAVRVGM